MTEEESAAVRCRWSAAFSSTLKKAMGQQQEPCLLCVASHCRPDVLLMRREGGRGERRMS